MSDLYNIPEIREHAERIVRNEVHYCVSHLISQILQAPDTWLELGVDDDDAYGLAECVDYESAALEHIDDADADDLHDFLTDRDVDFEEGTSIAELRELARVEVREQSGADREYCEHAGIDPERSDVFEHWIVSDWLARKLEAAGHPVARDFLGITIWGRPTTGQAISLDSVILHIARDCLNS